MKTGFNSKLFTVLFNFHN